MAWLKGRQTPSLIEDPSVGGGGRDRIVDCQMPDRRLPGGSLRSAADVRFSKVVRCAPTVAKLAAREPGYGGQALRELGSPGGA